MWKEVEGRKTDKAGMEEVGRERRKERDEKANNGRGEDNSKNNEEKGR